MQAERFYKAVSLLMFIIISSIFSANVGNITLYTITNTSISRQAHQFTMPQNGQITSISMYHNAASSSYKTQFGIYANGTNNLPGSKLAATAKTAMQTTAGWQTINLVTPIAVMSGSKIWITWMYQNTNGARRTGVVSGSLGYVTGSGTWSTTADNMPATFGSVTTTTGKNFSVYATFSPTYTITTASYPAGSGSVTLSPNKASYTNGEVVRINPVAGIGYTFSSWGGDASGNASYFDVTMNSNKNIIVNFNRSAINHVLDFLMAENNTLEINFSHEKGTFNPNISLSGGTGDGVMNNPEFWTSLRDSFTVLNPRLMRINIFDGLNISKVNGIIDITWEQFDIAINHIRSLGANAKPFITLFHMPVGIWWEGEEYGPTAIPCFDNTQKWDDYKEVCKKISLHMKSLNLSGLYYEVWNEPEGFWKPVCPEDSLHRWKLYNKLYKYSSQGILEGDPEAKIGGPATNPAHIESFLKEFNKDSAQIDFISWHWYNFDSKFSNYTRKVAEDALDKYSIPRTNMEYIISEYNANGEYSDMNDAFYNAGNLAKTQEFFRADSKLFGLFFLPRDVTTNVGEFGAFTIPRDPPYQGNLPKPSYNFFRVYSKMDGVEVEVNNHLSRINAWASKSESVYKILLWSFDRSHQFGDRLSTTLILKNIPNGQYTQTNYLIDSKNGNFNYDIANGKTPIGALKPVNKNVLIQGNLSIQYEMENGGVELIEFAPKY